MNIFQFFYSTKNIFWPTEPNLDICPVFPLAKFTPETLNIRCALLTQVIPTMLLNNTLLFGGTIVNDTNAAMGQNRSRAFVIGSKAFIVVFHA